MTIVPKLIRAMFKVFWENQPISGVRIWVDINAPGVKVPAVVAEIVAEQGAPFLILDLGAHLPRPTLCQFDEYGIEFEASFKGVSIPASIPWESVLGLGYHKNAGGPFYHLADPLAKPAPAPPPEPKTKTDPPLDLQAYRKRMGRKRQADPKMN